MKTILTSIAASSLLCTLAVAQPSPRYTVTDLGLVGGPPGQPFVIANNGLISEGVAASGTVWHAMLWFHGTQFDLAKAGGLGGPSSVAFGVNENGQAVGEAETPSLDRNGEDFCGFGSQHVCHPFVWQNGVMAPLSLLVNGVNGVANRINNHGQIAGTSENGKPDSTCPPYDPKSLQYQKYEFKPVIWQNGMPLELPTFSGDPDGIVFAINDDGQAVGATGECRSFVISGDLTYLYGLHATLWENGTVTNIPMPGVAGGGGNTAFKINNRGQVVGHMGIAGGPAQAYMWSKETGTQPLGTLPGDFTSVALSINDGGDIVGISLDAKLNPRAFVRFKIWEEGLTARYEADHRFDGGMLVDLNSLIPADSPLFLFDACSINSRKEIIGIAIDAAGNFHGYLATPNPSNTMPDSAAAPSANDRTQFDSARKLLQQRQISDRFGARAFPRR